MSETNFQCQSHVDPKIGPKSQQTSEFHQVRTITIILSWYATAIRKSLDQTKSQRATNNKTLVLKNAKSESKMRINEILQAPTWALSVRGQNPGIKLERAKKQQNESEISKAFE